MARITGHKIVDKWQLVVNMDGLQYQGNNGMRFNLYIAGYYDDPISTADSDNNGGEANVIFNITRVSPGWTQFVVKRVMFGTGNEYPVGYPFDEFVPSRDTPSPDPPKPQTQPMTEYFINSASFLTDRSVTIEFTVDGYGEVSMRSITWLQEGFETLLDRIKIDYDDDDLIKKGRKTIEFSYRFNDYGEESKFDMGGERGLPLGTIELNFESESYGYKKYANVNFLCVGDYIYHTYKDSYPVNLQPVSFGYKIAVASIKPLRAQWQLLINVFYYLSSTTIGRLKFGSRADYIPREGDVLTADMYNGLIDIAKECLMAIKVKYGDSASYLNPYIPNKVSKGDIIPKDFIYLLGQAANQMSKFIQKETNEGLVGRWGTLR